MDKGDYCIYMLHKKRFFTEMTTIVIFLIISQLLGSLMIYPGFHTYAQFCSFNSYLNPHLTSLSLMTEVFSHLMIFIFGISDDCNDYLNYIKFKIIPFITRTTHSFLLLYICFKNNGAISKMVNPEMLVCLLVQHSEFCVQKTKECK